MYEELTSLRMISYEKQLEYKYGIVLDEAVKTKYPTRTAKYMSKAAKRTNSSEIEKQKARSMSVANAREPVLSPLSKVDCKRRPKNNGSGGTSPTTIRESLVSVFGIAQEKPKVEEEAAWEDDCVSKALQRIANPPLGTGAENKLINGKCVRERKRGRRRRPEFEQPVSWLADKMSRLLFGDTAVDCAQSFYTHFNMYVNILKRKRK